MIAKVFTYLKKSTRFVTIAIITTFLVALVSYADQIYSGIIVKGSPWYDIRAYSSISDAVTAIGAGEKTLLVFGNVPVSADTTLPATMHVWYLGSGKFTIASGKVLTHSASISASNHLIWVGPGTIVPPKQVINLNWVGSLANAVALLTTATCDVEITEPYTQSVDVTTPATMSISFRAPGQVSVDVSKTWTISGYIDGRPGCFQGNGKVVPSALQLNSSDWWPSFEKAVTDIGSNSRGLLVTIPSVISGNLTCPKTLSLVLSGAGQLNAAGGTTLTINSVFDAGAYQVFAGSGTIVGLSKVRPEWWGADPKGVADSAAAVASAWAAIAATGGVLELDGTYNCSTGLNFAAAAIDNTHSWIIRGVGEKQAVIKTTNANIALDLGGQNRIALENLHIYEVGTTGKVGIARYRSLYGTSDGAGHNHKYRNVLIEGNFTLAGLYSVGSEVNEHYGITIINGGGGACYATGYTNFLALTGSGAPIDGGSYTVNNFHSGMMWSSTIGAAVHVASGITDNLNFYGTYLANTGGGPDACLGHIQASAVQGKINFDGVRFEGINTQAIAIWSATCWGLRVRNCHCGQTGGYDVWMAKHPDGYQGDGLVDCIIEGNWHSEFGILLQNGGKGNRIVIPQNVQGTNPPLIISADMPMINSWLEGPAINNQGAPGPGCIEVTHGDASPMRVRYGPTDPDPAYGVLGTWGSSIVHRLFGGVPVDPETGQQIAVDGTYWGPISSTVYPAFFDSAGWVPMTPIPGTIASASASGKRGTIVYDTSYIYFCVATDTWKRIAWPAW